MVRVSSLLNVLTYASAALGVAPLYLFLDLPAQLALPISFAVGIWVDGQRRYPFGGWISTLLSLAVFFLYALQIGRDNLIQPVINILALLLAVRLVTEKNGRNYLQIFVLSVFALASSTLLSLSTAFFLYLVLLVTGVTSGLVLLSFHSVDPDLSLSCRQSRRIIAVALSLPVASLVLMFAFFLILPRTQYPLWNFLNPKSTATAGFSEAVQPGSFAQILETKKVVLRAESERLPQNELYWRGIVLNTPEGSAWIRLPPPVSEKSVIRGGRVIIQALFPEPKAENYLPALDVTRNVEGLRSSQAADYTYRARYTLNQRVKYTSVSVVGGELVATGPIDRDFYLTLPADVSDRLRRVAMEIADRDRTSGDRITLAEEFFRDQQLTYATSDLPTSADPMGEFLFEKKRGYCEFFASSFALLLRLAGVPARLVGGYYGGQYNDIGQYYLVTEDTAHVWVEAFDEGRWVRIDPSRLARNAEASLLASRTRGIGAGRRLVDTIDYYWNRLVIAYDLGSQLQLLQQTNRKLKQFRVPFDLKKAGLYLVAVLAGAIGLALLFSSRRLTSEERMLRTFLRRVRKKYRLKAIPPATGLHELARQLDDPDCREFAEIFAGGVYRDRKLTKEELKKLRGLTKALKE